MPVALRMSRQPEAWLHEQRKIDMPLRGIPRAYGHCGRQEGQSRGSSESVPTTALTVDVKTQERWIRCASTFQALGIR